MGRKLEEILRNFAVWIYCLITVPTMGSLALVIRRHFWAVCWCRWLLMVLGIKIRVYKKAELPTDRVYVFMANHQSQLDIPVLEKVLEPYNIRFLAKRSLFQIPFFGWGIKALGYVPVEREDPKEGLKSLLLCVDKLKQGISLVIFPEGTRSPDGKLLPFKSAGFVVPIKAKVPVVPVVIKGTRDILPKGKLWFSLNRKEVEVYIGKPILTEKYSLKQRKELSKLVRMQMEKFLSK